MATNKHAQIRYNTLDKCFRNTGRNYTLDDLLEACNNAILDFDPAAEGIKRRQLFDDIRFMQSEQGWSIELNDELKFGKKKVYRYLDPTFSISQQPLSESDANHLKAALATLSRFKGTPQYDWIEELSLRLEDNFKLKNTDQNIISFEENPYLQGKEHITQLYNAIHYQKVLKITYKSFNNPEPIIFTLHPYHLKQYNNRWFLLGKDERFETLTNLALDRIEKIEETAQKYTPTDIDFEEYFDDVIGVSISEKPLQSVLLKVSPNAIHYIRTKPLHGSQKIRPQEEHFLVELNLIPNYELESCLLSYGENIEVLEPTMLRDNLKTRIEELYKNYKI
ncbi:helix-turn-helix transcriptional regulator [Namhaeicola litoreus]|uniref:Helix-turn-helix transcriptional regulator n=1 Tax=Namhaeicola litoreus TaxID=1052145 RepID=A0ABW3Y192_9FLAO